MCSAFSVLAPPFAAPVCWVKCDEIGRSLNNNAATHCGFLGALRQCPGADFKGWGMPINTPWGTMNGVRGGQGYCGGRYQPVFCAGTPLSARRLWNVESDGSAQNVGRTSDYLQSLRFAWCKGAMVGSSQSQPQCLR